MKKINIESVLQGGRGGKKAPGAVGTAKQKKEALERLKTLENLFGLNPNVRKYFEAGRLYYSYITGGGYLGSIDTIHYNPQYAEIVGAFEAQTSYLVYHVIESGNNLSLFYVSNDEKEWPAERPIPAGVLAYIVNVKSGVQDTGYIEVDGFQGALYRGNDKVLPSRPNGTDGSEKWSDVDNEIVERLEILKETGLETDLDITKLYMQDKEICCTILTNLFGSLVGVVDRISQEPRYEKLLQMLVERTSKHFYFVMGTNGTDLAFLFLSDNRNDWRSEKEDLKQGYARALVVSPKTATATVKQIDFIMVKGGPIFVV